MTRNYPNNASEILPRVFQHAASSWCNLLSSGGITKYTLGLTTVGNEE